MIVVLLLISSLVPYTTLFRSNVARSFSEQVPVSGVVLTRLDGDARGGAALSMRAVTGKPIKFAGVGEGLDGLEDRKSTRLNSSHGYISYAVFCLKKKKVCLIF